MSEGRYFSVPTVASYFRVQPDDIRRWIANGQIRAVNVAKAGQPAKFYISARAIADVIIRKPKATPKVEPKRLVNRNRIRRIMLSEHSIGLSMPTDW